MVNYLSSHGLTPIIITIHLLNIHNQIQDIIGIHPKILQDAIINSFGYPSQHFVMN